MLHGNTGIFRFAPISPTAHYGSQFPAIAENPDVEEVDGNYLDPAFDWSRYLPHEVLLDRREHNKFV